jgi:hypothetical protein
MADSAVWLERGGRGTGFAGQVNKHGFKTQEEMNDAGMGRTQWVGMPEWARGSGYNRAQIQAIVEKGLAGRYLGKRQRLLFNVMREVLAESDAWKENDTD